MFSFVCIMRWPVCMGICTLYFLVPCIWPVGSLVCTFLYITRLLVGMEILPNELVDSNGDMFSFCLTLIGSDGDLHFLIPYTLAG